MAGSRRNLLYTALFLAGGYSLLRFGPPAVSQLFAGDFEFEPVERPAGFRRLAAGQSSAGFSPLFGLDDEAGPGISAAVAEVGADPCGSLYGGNGLDAGVVPIASFSDYNCPFCRVLTLRLVEIEDAADGDVQIAWHELPLLGEASMLAAQGALAAKRQGAYVEFHRRLMRAPFRATPEYLEALAEAIGVDHDRLREDMQSTAVQEEIMRSSALAKAFGFIGTPALVVGRTVVQGEIDDATLKRLIDRERADGPIAACA